MARTGRIKSSLGIYHIIIRGQKKLINNENDLFEIKELFKKYFDKTNSKLYAYSINKNIIHLIAKSSEDINLCIKPLCTSFARYHNRIYQRIGKLFYDRYISEPIESYDELVDACCYIHKLKAIDNSFSEYKNDEILCDITDISKRTDISNILDNEISTFLLNDYQNMSDKELLDLLLSIYDKKLKELSIDEKKSILEFSTTKSNLSKKRVSSLLGLKKSSVSNKANKSEKAVQEEPKQNDRELSVWLL